jgi:hypothetical protein
MLNTQFQKDQRVVMQDGSAGRVIEALRYWKDKPEIVHVLPDAQNSFVRTIEASQLCLEENK